MPPLIGFREAYANLIGMRYDMLSEKDRQTVYAWEIYKDSQDILIGFDIFKATDLEPDFIDQQNRDTFQYTDDTIIKGNVIIHSDGDLSKIYGRQIKGKLYRELVEREKRLLYAYKLMMQGNSPETALIFTMAQDMRFIGHQLRNTYGFKDQLPC